MNVLWGPCALACLMACSGAQAASVRFEGAFTSQTTVCNGALDCNEGTEAIDLQFGSTFEVYFDPSGAVNYLVFGLPNSSAIHLGFEYMRDYVAPPSTTYEHELLVPPYGPNAVTASTFVAGDVHRYLESDWQTTGRQLIEEPDGSLSHEEIGWLVGASQQWDVISLGTGAVLSWGQQLTFSMTAPQMLGIPDVQRAWSADEFKDMVDGAYQQDASFSMQAITWTRDDANAANPTVSAAGWARITAVDGVSTIPEPATFGLMLLGLAALAVGTSRRRG